MNKPKLFRSEITLPDGSVITGCQSPYDGGFIVSLNNGPVSNRRQDGSAYWMEFVPDSGWHAVRDLTPEEDAAETELRRQYWEEGHSPWGRQKIEEDPHA